MDNLAIKLATRILVDTNLLIDAEEHDDNSSAETRDAAEVLSLSGAIGATVCLSEATVLDLNRAAEPLRQKRIKQLSKYQLLASPYMSSDFAKTAGFTIPLTPNDKSDALILMTLKSGAAQWLFTNDAKLRNKAANIGLEDRVFSIVEALLLLRTLTGAKTSSDRIRFVQGHELNLGAGFFDSFRADYPIFDSWWQDKVVAEQRPVLLIGEKHSPIAVAVLKIENKDTFGLPEPVLKICSFKVMEDHGGSRLGELLLFETIRYARHHNCRSMFLEVMPNKSDLLNWIEKYGFKHDGMTVTDKGEAVLVKHLEGASANPLDHAVRFGPGSIVVSRPKIIPIKPKWRRELLPRREAQKRLFHEDIPAANSIRKAYVSKSQTTQIAPGDTLMFYESKPTQQIVAIGVAEGFLRSKDASEIAQFVGKRTVFTFEDIVASCSKHGAIAIRFRLDRIIHSPVSLSEAIDVGLLKGAPMSIQRIGQRGIGWLKSNVDELR